MFPLIIPCLNSTWKCQETKRTLRNMTEDCLMVSAVSKEKDGSTGSLNTDISVENYTKDLLRSPSRRQRFQVMIDHEFLKIHVNCLWEFQARAAEMAAAGKARMSDFWYRHKDSSSGAEVAVDALSQHDVGLVNLFTSVRCVYFVFSLI